eukprot:Gb_41229 [translate_table: standard]
MGDHIQEWAARCREGMHLVKAQVIGRESPTIVRVPETLVNENRAAYIPQLISLGPLHFLQPRLAAMEGHKTRVVNSHILAKLPTNFFTRPLQILLEQGRISEADDFLSKMITQSLNCYDQVTIKPLDDETMALMMFRDASFLALFLRNLGRGETDVFIDSVRDVVKLENQIPLFLLKALHPLIDDHCHTSFEEFVAEKCFLLSPFLHKWRHGLGERLPSKSHLLDCIRNVVVEGYSTSASAPTVEETCHHHHHSFPPRRVSDYPFTGKFLPPAVELMKAGIKFRETYNGIRGIRFDKRKCTLYLPKVKGDLLTETTMRNLMAFELCFGSAFMEKAVISYAHLMNNLVESDKDVAVLRESEILCNERGRDKKVAQMWNSLCDSTSRPYFEPIDKAVDGVNRLYYNRKWKIRCTELKESYCSRPNWAIVSAVVGALSLLMSGVQVLCSFYTCNKKK